MGTFEAQNCPVQELHPQLWQAVVEFMGKAPYHFFESRLSKKEMGTP